MPETRTRRNFTRVCSVTARKLTQVCKKKLLILYVYAVYMCYNDANAKRKKA